MLEYTAYVFFQDFFLFEIPLFFQILCTIFKDYTLFTVMIKYLPYSPCCTIHPCSLSYTQQFVLPSPQPLYCLSPSFPLATTSLFSTSVAQTLLQLFHQCHGLVGVEDYMTFFKRDSKNINDCQEFQGKEERFAILCCTSSMGFNKDIMKCTHYYSFIYNSFTTLQIPCISSLSSFNEI